MMYNEIPHGKQNWYVQNSGIWQGVRIELCPSIYIERLDATPGDDGKFEIEARLAGVGLLAHEGSFAAETDLHASVHDNSGRCVFESSQKLDSTPLVQIAGNISNVLLWAPETPALYVLEVWLSGAAQYHRRRRFGFRKFEAREGKLYLNSYPFLHAGCARSGFLSRDSSHAYVNRIRSRDDGQSQASRDKHVRCHLKVAHPVYLDVADEVGMLIWTELPSRE
jgi:beta-galactosidase/beta-glucuronidase